MRQLGAAMLWYVHHGARPDFQPDLQQALE